MTKKKTPAPPPTEHQAIQFLAERCEKSGAIVLPQVRNGTGFTRTTRTADALIIETWPSRGQDITGIEYKRTLADFRRELAQGNKCEEIAAFCAFWTVLAPAGVIPVGDVPAAWGLWEIKGNRLMRTKPPERTDAKPPAIGFLCAILRANRGYDPGHAGIDEAIRIERERAREEHNRAMNEERKRNDSLRQKVSAFEKATGLSIQFGYGRDQAEVALEVVRHLKNPDVLRTEVRRHLKLCEGHLDSLRTLSQVLQK